ncbi:hypothetical protein [Pectobacterium versatile]|uniref:hypothetical protein n=1 Tax=Pectobacterium versatile TaxID=2488639 RepID=UPI00102E607D|nr:hypothetical protein [Pectobacterium versatile]TAI99801.1 hypothetical protein EG332_04115 [Pectobacterium versatile]UEQ10452.1 hypothetical protein LLE50_04900 [Pectobacterium versatile]
MFSKRVNRVFEGILASNEKTVTAKEFGQIIVSERQNIESVEFVPPRIGGKGFGEFKVTTRGKHYEVPE